MSNFEIYNKANKKTQKYLDTVFSLLKYFDENDTNVKSEDILPLSFFLAGLYSDEFIKEVFDSFNITFEKCFDYLKNPNVSFELISALETSEFITLSLESIYKVVLEKIKYDYYLDEKDVKYNDLEPFQLFDYIIFDCISDVYIDVINDLLRKTNNYEEFTDSDEYSNYEIYIGDEYDKFAKKFDVDILQNEMNSVIEEYQTDKFNIIVDSNRIYLFSNSNSPTSISTLDTESLITLGRTTEITKINDIMVNKNNINDLLNVIKEKNVLKITIHDYDKRKENTFTVLKKELFGSDKMENITNNPSGNTPNLDKYGEDLTNLHYIKDPSIGRDKELERIMKILLYPEKDKSIVITGVAGCGKTALVKGLAYRIQKGEVPESLKNLRIISIDTATMVAGTKFVGTLEEKMKKILEEASKDKNIILFIDEIHQTISGGKAEGNDNSVAEILKPYLDYGKTRIIGATTEEEYSNHIETNQAFKTRLKKVAIKEPDYETTYQVLNDLIEAYNKISYSKLTVDDKERKTIIDWLIESTKKQYRDYKDRASNPRLVLDILKETYAIAAFNESETVTTEHLIEALKNEDRLYESARERQSQILRNLKPRQNNNCKILEFKPRAY